MSALRSLRRAPGLATAAVLCLGLGTAATSAVTTLVSSLLLRPLPFPDSERLVRVWFEEPNVDSRIYLSIPEFADFHQVTAFDRFVGTAHVRIVALFDAGAERLRGEGVSRHYFETFGIRPALGRLLSPDDHSASTAPALILSHGAWTRYYGSDPKVIGRQLRTSRAVYTIVGVAQAGFEGTVEDVTVDFFIPVEHFEPYTVTTNRASRSAWAVARLAPGATLADAQGQVASIGTALARQQPAIYGRYRAWVEPMGESWRQRLRGGGTLLLGASLLLLLIAAINVGCLLLARVLDRRRELAIRASLGADAARLTSQLSLEALILVASGGLLGLVTGPLLLEAFLRLSPVTLPHYVEVTPDAATLIITIAVLSLAGLVAGTAPALVGRRVQPGEVLRGSGRGATGRTAERRWTAILIAGETALTLVLLVGAGLLLRSFDRLGSIDLGFDRAQIARLAVTVNPTEVSGPEGLPAIYDRLREAIAATPGVNRVGLVATTLPPWDTNRGRIRLEGDTTDVSEQGREVGLHFSDHGLLPMLNVPVVGGRNIAASDDIQSARVGVISVSLANVIGGPDRALGRTISFVPTDGGTANTSERFRVVGVAADVAWDGIAQQDTRRYIHYGDGADVRARRYDVYVPLAQAPRMVVSIGVSTVNDPASMIAPIRRVIGGIVPASAVHWTSTMDDEIALEYAASRFYAVIVAVFSASALALTSIGLFALLAHAAAQRTAEMGLRLALGATPVSTSALLLRTALAPLGFGIILGLGVTLAASRFIAGVLYGLDAFDPVTFSSAVITMAVVALFAGLIPARRVAKVDPITTLRGE